MSRFNIDFTKSNEGIIQQIDQVLKQSKQDVPKVTGSTYRSYEKLIEGLPKVRKLLEGRQRIPALSEAYKLTQSMEV
jgi:hypothetical protein